ncbi:MAG: ribokinase [Burkholderiales bacterium]
MTADSAGRRRVVVVGSSNMDLVIRVPRLPAPGETLAGHDFVTAPGGKGANQAVAAARLGAPVTFVSAVGDDAFGRTLLAGFAADGIDTSRVRTVAGTPTGVALVTVDAEGRNTIVLSPGANATLGAAAVAAAEADIAQAALVLCQLETPLSVLLATLDVAQRHQVPVLLNPAPAAPLTADVLRRVRFLVPNESEAAVLSGVPVIDLPSAQHAAAALRARGAADVLVTLGAGGVWQADGEGGRHHPAPHVEAVDTTAAGDTFIGGLAAELAAGVPLAAAIAFGQRAAALAVTRHGAQASIPGRAEVEAFLR